MALWRFELEAIDATGNNHHILNSVDEDSPIMPQFQGLSEVSSYIDGLVDGSTKSVDIVYDTGSMYTQTMTPLDIVSNWSVGFWIANSNSAKIKFYQVNDLNLTFDLMLTKGGQKIFLVELFASGDALTYETFDDVNHIVICCDGTSMYLYVDNVLRDSKVYAGLDEPWGEQITTFHGAYDEVFIVDALLTEAQRQYLLNNIYPFTDVPYTLPTPTMLTTFDNSTGDDSSGNGNGWTLEVATYVAGKFGIGAGTTSDYSRNTVLTGSIKDNWTVGGWFFPNTDEVADQIVFVQSLSGGSNWQLIFSPGGDVQASFDDQTILLDGIVNLDAWNFVAVVSSPTSVQLYVNSQVYESDLWSNLGEFTFANPITLDVLNGIVDDFFIIDERLTGTDLRHLFVAGPYEDSI